MLTSEHDGVVAFLERLVMEQRSTGREFPFVKELVKYIGEAYFREGEAKGEVKAIRAMIVRLAQRRGLVLSDKQQRQIQVRGDRHTLDRWFDNVLDATSADDIFR